MIKSLLVLAVVSLCSCSRSARTLYTEEDVRAFVQPGTSRAAIFERFGEPLIDEKNPKFEGGYTGVDEIIYYFLPSKPRQRKPNDDWVFAGFQVRLKEGKAVEWMATHSD
jgi:hypothetical protein